MVDEERHKLLDTNPLNIINYIKSSVEILLSMKEEEMDTIRKEKSDKILKLKTKMKKIQSDFKSKKTKGQVFQEGFAYQNTPSEYLSRRMESGGPMQKKKPPKDDAHDGSSFMRNSSLMNSSKESGFKTFLFEPPQEYEDMICKLEADVRKHI